MKRITLAHGAGGAIMHTLIKDTILEHFKTNLKLELPLEALDDSSVYNDIAFTTDSYVVKPLFFPGGDIGSLSVAGTVNDLAVIGAEPLALSVGLILEEGLLVNDLDKILISMERTSKLAEVPIITGDTKVIERGGIQGMIINTSGIGRAFKWLEHNNKEVNRYRRFKEKWLADSNLRNGDKIIVSGNIGDHGIALLSFREGYGFETKLQSDIYPLNKMIASILKEGGTVAMKDPTRGGLANTLNEWSEKSKVGILIEEEHIPINEAVKSACEMLGLDPLTIGNEGKVVIGVVKEKAERILEILSRHPKGKNAAIIGEVRKDLKGVVMRTALGGKRIIEQPIGDPVPRIC